MAVTNNSTTTCGQTVSSFLGLNFKVYCNYDIRLTTYREVFTNSLQECVDNCMASSSCFGITWTPDDHRCSHKSRIITNDDLLIKSGTFSVLPLINQTKPTEKEIACPYPNLSRQTTASGLEFKILCGASLSGDDLYSAVKDPRQFMHAESLQECLENCANVHPLCSRVTWSADRTTNLWLNCQLKPYSEYKPLITSGGMRHSAYAMIPTLDPVDCKNATRYTTSDDRTFISSCQDQRLLNGTNLLSTSHERGLEACGDRCAASKTNCSTYAFDVGMQSGYQNCYLFNSMPVPIGQNSNYTFMYLDSMASQYVPPPPSPQTPRDKNRDVAIGVTTPLGVIILALMAFQWYRLRKRHSGRNYFAVKGD